jgi:hypothetical protein
LAAFHDPAQAFRPDYHPRVHGGLFNVQQQTSYTKIGQPTAAALNAATTCLEGLDDGNQKFILLATDGVPNCGGTPANVNTNDLKGANTAAAAG